MMRLDAAGVLGRLMRHRVNVCYCESESGASGHRELHELQAVQRDQHCGQAVAT